MTSPDRPGLDRRSAWLMAFGGVAALVVVALLVVPWDWVPGGELVPMPAGELFTTEQIARAEQFSSHRRVLNWTAYGLSLMTAAILGFTPLGARLTRRLTGSLRWWQSVGLAVLILLVLGRLVVLPFALLLREQSLDYGLTHQGIGAWLGDQGLGLLVSWVMTSLVLILIVGLAHRFPRRWFAPAGVLASLAVVVGSLLYPVLVEPLFNDFESMPAGQLRASVVELADREHVAVEDVLIADASRRTTTLNAYVSGLGGTRRVVVYDTLLQQMSRSEAEVVIAHELAHAKNRDVLVGTTLGALGALAVIPLGALVADARWVRKRAGISGPGDPRAVALLLALFAIGSLVTSPATNGVSRAIEVRADREALDATRDDTVYVEVQRQLALKAFHDPTPPAWSQFWFGSHPTVLQRAGLPASLEAAR